MCPESATLGLELGLAPHVVPSQVTSGTVDMDADGGCVTYRGWIVPSQNKKYISSCPELTIISSWNISS